MRDNVLDLASDGEAGAAKSMVAQVATLARSFMHEIEVMNSAELKVHLAALAAMQGDDATTAARDLVACLLTAAARTHGNGLQAAAG